MNDRVMSPAPVQPNDGPYEHQSWPAWRYGPDNQSATFDRAEDVPDGWVTLDEKNDGTLDIAEDTGVTGAEQARKLTAGQRKSAIAKLVDNHTQTDLADMLSQMKEIDDTVEFLPSWPKQKLAETIVDNGGPLEAE